MRKSRFSEAQIVAILKEGEAGVPVAEILRKHGIYLPRFRTLEKCRSGPGLFWGPRRLSVHWFTDLRNAQRMIAIWRHDYDDVRPHRGLSLRTPAEFMRSLLDHPDPEPKLST